MGFKLPSWLTGKKAEIPAEENSGRPCWYALVPRFSGGYWRGAPYRQLRLALLLQILIFTSGALFFFLWLSVDDAIRIGPRERVLGNLEMHLQRIALVVPKALEGSPAGFVELEESRDESNHAQNFLVIRQAQQIIASENELLRQHLQNLLKHDHKQNELRSSLPWLMLLAMVLALLSGFGLSRMLSRNRVISEALVRDKAIHVIDLVSQVALASFALKEKMHVLLSLHQKQVRHREGSEQTMLKVMEQLTQMTLKLRQAVTLPDRAVECVKRSATALTDTEREMHQLNEQIKASVSQIENLGISSCKITEMTDLISDIVEQSNILAVNAALQAASADEAGQSFTVIAEELQRQVQQTQNTLQKIVGLLGRMQSETQSAAAALENANVNAMTAVQALDVATTSLSDVQDTSSQWNGVNALILSSSDQQAQLVYGAVQELQHILAEDKSGQVCIEQALSLLSVLDEKIELLGNCARHFPGAGSSSNTPDIRI